LLNSIFIELVAHPLSKRRKPATQRNCNITNKNLLLQFCLSWICLHTQRWRMDCSIFSWNADHVSIIGRSEWKN